MVMSRYVSSFLRCEFYILLHIVITVLEIQKRARFQSSYHSVMVHTQQNDPSMITIAMGLVRAAHQY